MKRNYVNRALFIAENAAATCFTSTKLFTTRTATFVSAVVTLHFFEISTFDTVKLTFF